MWFPPDSKLTAERERTGFLALAWNEMFDPLTPDSYQPRLSNTPSLINEIGNIAQRLEQSSKWQKHFDVLQEELGAVVEDEADLLQALPYYRWLADAFCKRGAKDLVKLLPAVQQFEPKHKELVEERLRTACEKLPHRKEEALIALRRYATIALQNECTPAEMVALANDAALELSPASFIESLITAVNIQPTTMRCCIAVEGSISDVKALCRKVGFQILPQKQLDTATGVSFVEKVAALQGEAMHSISYVVCQLAATSPRLAVKKAIRKLRDALDVFNFYSEHNAATILPLALIHVGQSAEEIVPIGEHELRRRGPRRARRLTLDTLKRIPLNNLDGRILNALEHYSLAHASTATRVKLVNLWTALECLIGSSESIIGGICQAVAPIVAWRRSDKIVTYTATCIHEYRVKGNTKTLDPKFVVKKGEAISREQLLRALARPENHPDILQLLDFAADHPLLRNRIYRLWQTFSDPKQLATELLVSKRRVEWHLYRIYRSRNFIVHEGQDTQQVQALLDNLHYYFTITLSRVLHGMQMRKGLLIDESLAYWRSRFEYLIDSLRSQPSAVRICDIFAQAGGAEASQPIWEPTQPVAAALTPPPSPPDSP